MLGNYKGFLYIGSISVGVGINRTDSEGDRDPLSTRSARQPRPYDRDLSANYGHALHKCQRALVASRCGIVGS